MSYQEFIKELVRRRVAQLKEDLDGVLTGGFDEEEEFINAVADMAAQHIWNEISHEFEVYAKPVKPHHQFTSRSPWARRKKR